MIPLFTKESGGIIFYDNDICLMITGASFEMTSSGFVSNLTIGETGECRPGLNCNLSGWGSEKVMNSFNHLGQGWSQIQGLYPNYVVLLD